MTNIFVGFHDQRSCNRILKPPGGGTSDIFSTGDSPKYKKETEIINSTAETNLKSEKQSTNVENVKSAEEIDKLPAELENSNQADNSEVEKSEEIKIESLTIKDSSIEIATVSENREHEVKIIKPKEESVSSLIQQDDFKIETPKKITKSPNRVPPGGYSSGLW